MNKLLNKSVRGGYFLISILLNIFMIACTLVIVLLYKDRIISSIQNRFCAQNPSENVLARFNNEQFESVNDSLIVGSEKTISCLFLGNSIAYTEVPDEDQDKEKRGLASTSKEKDYVHVLVRKIAEEHHINVRFSIINVADFERSFLEKSFPFEELSKVSNQQPDYLFVQIGENVSKEDIIDSPDKFERAYEDLLDYFPNSKRIITIPFWPDYNKEYLITRVAIKTNSYLVDISHLGDGDDSKAFASSYRNYSNPGVGEHPGDYGMTKIAECIYAIFNAIENDKINYNY